MIVHHLNCATMCPAFGRLVNPERRLVCHCLLVETEAGLVLVDTGLGTADVARPRELGRLFLWTTGPVLSQAETAKSQIEALGFAVDDVRHVVVTHLDVDHAGGLPDFPDAEVHVYQPELDAALSRATRPDRRRYHSKHWSHEPRWAPHAPDGESWFGFESVRAIGGTDDEILIVPLVGHSPGHAGIAIKGDGGWLLHCGDAYFYRDELDPERPHCSFGLRVFQRVMQADGRARRQNQERLRQLRAQQGEEVRLFCAHDPAELEALATPSQ